MYVNERGTATTVPSGIRSVWLGWGGSDLGGACRPGSGTPRARLVGPQQGSEPGSAVDPRASGQLSFRRRGCGALAYRMETSRHPFSESDADGATQSVARGSGGDVTL